MDRFGWIVVLVLGVFAIGVFGGVLGLFAVTGLVVGGNIDANKAYYSIDSGKGSEVSYEVGPYTRKDSPRDISINCVDGEKLVRGCVYKIEINGADCTIRVLDSSCLKKIEIHGVDIRVVLPSDANVAIDDNGIDTIITYK